MANISMMYERDVLAQPFFEVFIKGKLLPPQYHKCIQEVSVEDEEGKLGLARITILDTEDFYFVNNKDLVKDASVVVYLGHINYYRKMVEGKISIVEPDFRQDGIVTIVVSVIDSAVSSSKVKKSRSWISQKKSAVVRAICAENGWSCITTDTKIPLPQITQNNETDLTFINRLASEEGFMFHKIDESNYFFGLVNLKDPPLATINYRMSDCSIIDCSMTYVSVDETAPSSSNIDASTGQTEERQGEAPVSSNSNSTPANGVLVDKKTGDESVGRPTVEDRG